MTNLPHPIDILDFLSCEDVDLPELRIVDVGAMDRGENELWSRLVSGGTASLIGFEPNPAECEKLNSANRANCRFLPHALGDGAAHTLYIGKEPMTSSIFPPDPEVMQRFHNLWELSETVDEDRSTQFVSMIFPRPGLPISSNWMCRVPSFSSSKMPVRP